MVRQLCISLAVNNLWRVAADFLRPSINLELSPSDIYVQTNT